MLEIILTSLFLIEIFLTLGFMFYIGSKVELEYNEHRKTFFLSALKDFIKKIFVGRNWFGIVINVFILILLIPAILLLLIIEAIIWLMVLLYMLWSLGDKKKK